MGDHVDFDDHLKLPGLTEQFASQTDAYLYVDAKFVPVHSAVLAVQSPVFADMFKLASDNDTTAHRRNGRVCLPMTSHSFVGVCAAIKFLYQWTTSDWENTPSKDIWKDIDTAQAILQFAHKFNMKSILKDCDLCLSKKAQEKYAPLGGNLFDATTESDAVVLWAALAEECKLTELLSHAELFMAKNMTPTSWLCDSTYPATSQLSSPCLFRVLRAAQLYTNHYKKAQCLTHTNQKQTRCQHCNKYCLTPIGSCSPAAAAVEYVRAEDLRKWQLQGRRCTRLE